MFTGLVEGTGRIVSLEPGGMTRLVVSANLAGDDARIGDSVSVNGVCLTVNEVDRDELVFHAMPETLRRTALGGLSKGSLVNLERAMGAGSRLGDTSCRGMWTVLARCSACAPKETLRCGRSRRRRTFCGTPWKRAVSALMG